MRSMSRSASLGLTASDSEEPEKRRRRVYHHALDDLSVQMTLTTLASSLSLARSAAANLMRHHTILMRAPEGTKVLQPALPLPATTASVQRSSSLLERLTTRSG